MQSTRTTPRILLAAAISLVAAGAWATSATVGDTAPGFQLKTIDGKAVSLADYKGKLVVLEWMNPNCRGDWVPAAEYDRYLQKRGITYPVLRDESGAIGHAYEAKTTPHMFIIDASGKVVYNGAIDDDPSGRKDKQARVNYVGKGLSAEEKGGAPDPATTKPYGCTVKY
jgi:hypothetical protein